MTTQFKTFVKKDRTEFIGVNERGEIATCGFPVNTFNVDATEEDIRSVLFTDSKEDEDWLFDNADLVTFEMKEVK